MPKRDRDEFERNLLDDQFDESDDSEYDEEDSNDSDSSADSDEAPVVLNSKLQRKLLRDDAFILAFSKRLKEVKTANIERYEYSVVDIASSGVINDHANPWLAATTSKWFGSGFIIEYKGHRMLITNAHVAEMSSLIEVRLPDEAKRYTATVKQMEHDCDLAWLDVAAPEFWEKVIPLELADMPTMRSPLAVVGFPRGGEELCITEGKVSRIEVDSYCHSGVRFIHAQVSAPINPGNSGGPAINQKGQVVGVAFQGDDGDGMGFIIPTLILEHFLDDVLDESRPYQGFPDWAFQYQTTQNKGIKSYYGLEDEVGVVVVKANKLTGLNNYLKPNDIIIALDGNTVKDDGTVETKYSKRLDLSYLLSRKQIGETMCTTIIRDGEVMDIDIPMLHRANTELITGDYRADIPPTFYITCGVVLQPLTAELCDEFADSELEIYKQKEKKFLGQECVVISEQFATEHTKGLHSFIGEIITHVNGQKINNLREAIAIIEACEFGDYFDLKTKDKHIIRLTRLTPEENLQLLAPYRVTKICSDDLLKPQVWRPGCPEYYAQQQTELEEKAKQKSGSDKKKYRIT